MVNGFQLQLVCIWVALTSAVPPNCISRSNPRSSDEVCADFCNGKCAFFNTTGCNVTDSGLPKTMDLYRVTPFNTTTPDNKDFGNIDGDLGFYFYLKAGSGGKFLRGENIVGHFQVQVNGQWGPYLKCNPRGDIANASAPYDNFLCDYDCLDPPCPPLRGNSTNGSEIKCSCPVTHREHHAVGREADPVREISVPETLLPKYPAPPKGNLNCSYYINRECHVSPNQPVSECISCVKRYPWVSDACGTNPEAIAKACTMSANYTKCLDLVGSIGHVERPTDAASYSRCFEQAYSNLNNNEEYQNSGCGFKWIEYFCEERISSWWPYAPYALTGGLWYSLPAEGKCESGIFPGTNSACSWGVKSVRFINETCLTDRIDNMVKQRLPHCFASCQENDDECDHLCYFIGLSGNRTAGLDPLPLSQLNEVWKNSFNAVEDGGCPSITPRP